MGFFDENYLESKRRKKKRKSKKRKRKKTTESTKNIQKIKTPEFKKMISVFDQMPPDTKEQILTWDSSLEFRIAPSFIVKQHLLEDIKVLGYCRISHWYPLKEM